MPSTVYERNGKWGARCRIDGKDLWLGSFDTEGAAREAVRLAKPGGAAKPRHGAGFTVSEWAAVWQDLYPGLRNDETAAHNASMVAGFVRSRGSCPMAAITPLEAQSWALSSPGSVRYLRLMWSKAVRAGIVQSNPWEQVEVRQRRRSGGVPSAEMVDQLAGAAYGRGWQDFGDMIVFTAYSGLRLSEVADVQAGDVLSGGRRVHVRGKRRAGEVEPRPRTAAVFGPGVEALLRHCPEVGLVWRSPTGLPLNRDMVSDRFVKVRRDAMFLGTFHSLRKFHASWLADQGADARDIAQQLGHIDASGRPYPELVNRVYSHPSAEFALQRLEAVAR